MVAVTAHAVPVFLWFIPNEQKHKALFLFFIMKDRHQGHYAPGLNMETKKRMWKDLSSNINNGYGRG